MASESTVGDRWARAAGVIARRVAGETVLVPVANRTDDPEFKRARLYVLNDTGEFLWSLLDTPHTAADLAQNLTLAFETTAGRAHSDVDLFLSALRDIGAVRALIDGGPE